MSSHKKTKIVATLGPASSNFDIILKMCERGVDVFRLNFSHGTHQFHQTNITHIRTAEKETGRPIAILADLQGPKFRVGTFKEGHIHLKPGQEFTLDLNEDALGTELRVAFPHKDVFPHVKAGSRLLLDDGKIELRIIRATPTSLITEVIVGGTLSNHKGVNLPEDTIPGSALTKKDLSDLKFILNEDIDFIALSFVQQPSDLKTLQQHVKGKAKIIAKIEKPQAIDNLLSIIHEADGIMVARGDLGVEFPPEYVPALQKRIVEACRIAGKPVIVATQMLESMVEAPTPTRAETSDVANAVYDGADAVMLSAESAAGKYPLESIDMMARIILQVENDPTYPQFRTVVASPPNDSISDNITLASQVLVNQLSAAAIVTYTTSGLTAFRESQKRPLCFILGLTESQTVSRQLCLAWGVLPYLLNKKVKDFEELTQTAKELVQSKGLVKKGEIFISTFGVPFGHAGTTNIINVQEL